MKEDKLKQNQKDVKSLNEKDVLASNDFAKKDNDLSSLTLNFQQTDETLSGENSEQKNIAGEELKQSKMQKKKYKLSYNLDRFFHFSQRGSSVKQEFYAGFINFLVLSYIMVVIPGLYSNIGSSEMWKAIFVATILVTIIMTVCSALYSNLPIVLAPGIGIVSYMVQLVEGGVYTFEQTMAIALMSGIFFLILTLSGLRKKIVNAIPSCIKVALPAGVGLFILNIGFKNGGIVELLNGSANSLAGIVALVSFVIMIVLYVKKVKGSIFYGILGGTIVDVSIKFCSGINPFEVLTQNSWLPPFKELFSQTFFKFDFAGLFNGNFVTCLMSVILTIFAIVMIDMFDTVGTLYATAKKGNLLDENGEVINMNKIMLIDGGCSIFSSMVGLPNASSYVESSTGIASGARTGLSVIFTSLFFVLALFLSPLVMLIPVYATAPALVLVGIMMFDCVKKIDFDDLVQAIPSVLTIILMPLTNNISFGIAGGIICYTLLMLCSGKAKKVSALTYVISALFILYFAVQYI